MENVDKEGIVLVLNFRFFVTEPNQSGFPIRRGEIMTILFPLIRDFTTRADSCARSQKYSGSILPVTINGFVTFVLIAVYIANIIILFALCKSNHTSVSCRSHPAGCLFICETLFVPSCHWFSLSFFVCKTDRLPDHRRVMISRFGSLSAGRFSSGNPVHSRQKRAIARGLSVMVFLAAVFVYKKTMAKPGPDCADRRLFCVEFVWIERSPVWGAS